MLTARPAAATGGNAMDDVIAHVGDGRIDIIRGAACLSNDSTSFKHTGSFMKKVDELIAGATIGSPVRHQALSVFPLTHKDRCAQ
jgi:hypothetical protein